MITIKPYFINKTDIITLKYHIPDELMCIKEWLWYVERKHMSDSHNELNWSIDDFMKQYDVIKEYSNGHISYKWLDIWLHRPHLQINNNDIIVYLINCNDDKWVFPSCNLKLILHE